MRFIVTVVPCESPQFLIAEAPGENPQDAERSHKTQPDAREETDAIDPEHRCLSYRGIVAGVDLSLLSSSPEENGAARDHE